MRTGGRGAPLSFSLAAYPLEQSRFQSALLRALKIIFQIFSVFLDVSQNFNQPVDLPIAAFLIMEFVMRLG